MTETPPRNPYTVTLSQPKGTWVVRTADAVIAESSDVVALSDGSGDPVIYFPKNDIAMAFLDESAHTTEIDTLGTASYFSIVLASGTLLNAAWTFMAPPAEASALKDRLAFQGDNVAIEQL